MSMGGMPGAIECPKMVHCSKFVVLFDDLVLHSRPARRDQRMIQVMVATFKQVELSAHVTVYSPGNASVEQTRRHGDKPFAPHYIAAFLSGTQNRS